MYRLLCLLVFVGLSEQVAFSGRCNSQHQLWPWVTKNIYIYRNNVKTVVEKIASDYIKADISIQNFCNSHTDHYLRETYGMVYYKLTLAVDDFDESSINVKVVHRLVYIGAEDCSFTYTDLRVLPDVVDPTKGKWKYAEGELNIYFPYIIRPDEQMEKNCGDEIKSEVFTVPKCDDDTDFDDIDIDLGDITFRNNLREFLAHR